MTDARRASRPFSFLRTTLVLTFGLVSATAAAEPPTLAQMMAIRAACRADYEASCAGVPVGGGAALECLRIHAASTSPACQQALSAVGGAAPAAPRAPAAPAVQTMDRWPHTYRTAAGTATVYQPQVIAWAEHRTLETRMAVGILPNGAKAPVLGTINVAFTTEVDTADRAVILTAPRLSSSRFPTVGTARAARLEERIKAELALMGPKRVPLAMVVLSLLHQKERLPDVALNNDPPRILVSTRRASLVVFDGEPVLAPIAGTSLSFVVNTNWDVFLDAPTKTWYLLDSGAWLTAPFATGPWTTAGMLPAAFSALPDDASFAAVKRQIPGRALAAKDAPTIFVSTTPAAIIVTAGPPRYIRIAGTSLEYVANTDAHVFRDTATGTIYKKTDSGWEKYGNGGWTPVQPPATSGGAGQRAPQGTTASQGAATSPRNLSGATERPAGQGAPGGVSRENWSQLENDRAARLGGAQRFQQYGAMRSGELGGFRGTGGRSGGFRR